MHLTVQQSQHYYQAAVQQFLLVSPNELGGSTPSIRRNTADTQLSLAGAEPEVEWYLANI